LLRIAPPRFVDQPPLRVPLIQESERNRPPANLPASVGGRDDSDQLVFERAADEDATTVPLDEALFVDRRDVAKWREARFDQRTWVIPSRRDVDSRWSTKLQCLVWSLVVVLAAPKVEAPLLGGDVRGWR